MVELRLADLIAALSQASDLGMGQPPESAVRTCLVATSLARSMDVSEPDVRRVYYTSLLQHVGCTAYAYETAALFGGNDIDLRARGARLDSGDPRSTIAFLLHDIGRGTPPLTRTRAVLAAVRMGGTFDSELSRSNCDVAVRVASRLELDGAVQQGLNHIYERWDGKGNPHKVRGDDIALPARFTQVASQAVLFNALGGSEFAVETVRRRAGTMLDPTIAHAFAERGGHLLAECDAIDTSLAVIEVEPPPFARIPESDLDRVAATFGDMVDMKSPLFHGHSRGVSRLAAAGAAVLGLSPGDIDAVRRTGLLHDLGRVSIAGGIWDKPGPLTAGEWEQVRLLPYHSERILARSTALSPLAKLAGMHRERQDGSGYHRQAVGPAIPMGARLLAAADAYQAMTEDRAHRPARASDGAAEEVRREVAGGRLDAEAAGGILEAAGHRFRRVSPSWPAGLTGREVEVLRLAARGAKTREIAQTLHIALKTADHHLQHIYAKIGVSTRAGAAMFAMEHDLLGVDPVDKIG